MNERLALDQVVEMLVPSCLSLFLIDRRLHYVSQLRTVEEGARILQDVLRAVVQYFTHEKTQQRIYFWVLSEILFILNSQFELYFEL